MKHISHLYDPKPKDLNGEGKLITINKMQKTSLTRNYMSFYLIVILIHVLSIIELMKSEEFYVGIGIRPSMSLFISPH